MRPYYNTAQCSLGEIKDCITDGRRAARGVPRA
jgi:hypothetical protein